VGVFITHLRKESHAMFERGVIVELLGEDAFYEDVSKAMRRLTREIRFTMSGSKVASFTI
jgi:hypothetical protein